MNGPQFYFICTLPVNAGDTKTLVNMICKQSPALLCHVNAEDGGTMLLQNVGNYLSADAG
jgi:hypothetical protein